MNGLPTHCTTRADYEYIKAENITGWQDQWRRLLEGRFVVEGDELALDANAAIYRLGYTVAEVEQAIGFSGLTARESEWRREQPDRWQLVDGDWVEIEGWAAARASARLLAAMEEKLAEVDAAVAQRQSGTFAYAGHSYYLDHEYISGQVAALAFLPDDYSRQWKTADKSGVDNIYVELDKAGLIALAMACFAQFNANWEAGDAVKKRLKALYASGEDVSGCEVEL